MQPSPYEVRGFTGMSCTSTSLIYTFLGKRRTNIGSILVANIITIAHRDQTLLHRQAEGINLGITVTS